MGREEVASEVSDLTDPIGFIDDVLAHRALEALETGAARLEWLPDCLVHEDFWPGNTVWSRNELVGVIDWANAKVGDPRFDLAQCRVDVLIANGMKVSDALVEACGRLNPRITHDLWFFDLLLGLRALTQFRTWLLGYHDAGLDHLTEELAEGRIRELLSRSLVAASAASRP